LSLGFALVHMSPRAARATPRPTIPKLTAVDGTAYQHRVRQATSTPPAWFAFFALTLALAVDLIPWLFSHRPNLFVFISTFGITGLPGGIENGIDTRLLVVGVIGLGTLLAGTALVGRSAILIADQQGLLLRHGIIRREIPWQAARQFLVRDHGD